MTSSPSRRNVPVYASLHPVVYAALAGCVLWIVAVSWIFFGGNLYSAVQLAVVTVFAAMFLATPLALLRMSGRRGAAKSKLREWMEGEIETPDGTVDAKHAMVMALIAPIACVGGITAVGLMYWLVSIGAV